jgi:hypothetical protein
MARSTAGCHFRANRVQAGLCFGGDVRRVLRRAAVLVMTLLALAGCATRVWNQPINQLDSSSAFDFRTRLPAHADDVFIVLAFSGGGTQSTAFAYGVLKKLRDTTALVDGQQRRLLDEVDVKSSNPGSCDEMCRTSSTCNCSTH